MRLISEDDAFMVLSLYYHHRTATQADALREALELVPEAVVRCFECKAFILKAEKPRYTCYNPNGLDDPKPNDYCSHGERISDEID